jgi:hypothetical protein
VLFQDDFGAGYERYWWTSLSDDGPVSNALEGNNRFATLDASDHSYTRLRCNFDGSLFRNTDITASMQFRVDLAPTSSQTVRLDVRQASGTENIFYAVGATISSAGAITKVSIFKKVAVGTGDYTICSLAEGKFATPVAMGQWHLLRLSVSGTSSVRLTAYYDDAQMATAIDDCVSPLTATNGTQVANPGCLADQTGLGIQVETGIVASVDDVLVTAP